MPTSSVGRTSKTRGQTDLSQGPAFGPRGQIRLSPGFTAGVTLLELTVVIAIIGLIVGISYPSVSSGLDAVRLATATDSVASFLNGAVNRAERHQVAVQVIISPQENRLVLYSSEPGFTRELKMPEGIRIEAVLPEAAEEPDGEYRLIVLPGATVPGIGVRLANRHGGRRQVKLDPMTGFPRVESVQAE